MQRVAIIVKVKEFLKVLRDREIGKFPVTINCPQTVHLPNMLSTNKEGKGEANSDTQRTVTSLPSSYNLYISTPCAIKEAHKHLEK